MLRAFHYVPILLLLLSVLLARENAVILILCRNSDKSGIIKSLESFENRFNKKFKYPYVFLNDDTFTEDFKESIRQVVSGTVQFGKLNEEEFGVPNWINMAKAENTMQEMKQKGIIYGDSLSYRKMCRFFSGYFYRHELVRPYDYYWRIEPDITYFCDIDYDPFEFLKKNNKIYGFVISLREFMETIPSLFRATTNFIAAHKDIISATRPNIPFVTDNNVNYNGCHFWSNFEIGSFEFFRSELYQKYFDFLDRQGGFFYERWGDAPVHSLALSLFVDKDKIHFFNDIGYEHPPFQHCPADPAFRNKCSCQPSNSFDYQINSCLPLWLKNAIMAA